MDRVKKKFNRFEQLTAQTVGRAEKTEVLAEKEDLDERVERMLTALHLTRVKLESSLRSRVAKEESIEKRKKRLEEYQLVNTLQTQSAELLKTKESVGNESQAEMKDSLLGRVMDQYGQGLSEIVDELVRTESDIEKRALGRLAKYSDEATKIKHMKDKLKKSVLDMDVCKRKLHTATKDGEVGHHQKMEDELTDAETKVDNNKDNLLIEMYQLSGKEVEVAQVFNIIVDTQLEYFRTATKILEDLKPQITEQIATYPRRPVFGCHLEDHLRYSGRSKALVLEIGCCALVELGLQQEGLFRVSGNQIKIKKLKASLDAGQIDLSDYAFDPHSIAGAMKSYLRELPDPLMTHNLYSEWVDCEKREGEAKLIKIKETLSKLPAPNFENLQYLIKFLVKVAENQDETKMSASNLAIVMGPNLIRDSQSNEMAGSALGSKLVETLIVNADYFFPGDIRYTSSLTGSLHDRNGGFVLQGPIVSNNPYHQQQQQTGGGGSKHASSPPQQAVMVDGNHSGVKGWMMKRPKAPAPPPPPSLTTSTANGKQQQQQQQSYQFSSPSPPQSVPGKVQLVQPSSGVKHKFPPTNTDHRPPSSSSTNQHYYPSNILGGELYTEIPPPGGGHQQHQQQQQQQQGHIATSLRISSRDHHTDGRTGGANSISSGADSSTTLMSRSTGSLYPSISCGSSSACSSAVPGSSGTVPMPNVSVGVRGGGSPPTSSSGYSTAERPQAGRQAPKASPDIISEDLLVGGCAGASSSSSSTAKESSISSFFDDNRGEEDSFDDHSYYSSIDDNNSRKNLPSGQQSQLAQRKWLLPAAESEQINKGHRKTASLDQQSISTAVDFTDDSGRNGRSSPSGTDGAESFRAPGPHEVDKLLQSLQLGEHDRHNNGNGRNKPDSSPNSNSNRQQAQQPSRPPPPKQHQQAKHSMLRNSFSTHDRRDKREKTPSTESLNPRETLKSRTPEPAPRKSVLQESSPVTTLRRNMRTPPEVPPSASTLRGGPSNC